jgi:response regulator RpfG family c-di-GMP phosphodiesterase
VLIVDDEVRILTALSRSLRREGWEILTAESPAEALRMIEQAPVDVVLSDHKMPGMSGLEMLAKIGQMHPETVRLLITGWAEAVSPDELAAVGVSALIPKPWDDQELKGILRSHLGSGP